MKNNLTGHQPSKSALTDFVLLTVISIITALSAAYALRIPSDSLNITILTLLFHFIYNRELPPLSATGKYWILIFSVILSSASIQGALLRIKGETYTGLVKENYKLREKQPVKKTNELGKKYKCVAAPRYTFFFPDKIYEASDNILSMSSIFQPGNDIIGFYSP